mmetsp:Transcript_54566/g.145718  ORF Transcript_54566/g.145718 Transcript_54566/m.145718 type:complete len:261 (-) Transcript_54566:325-1107(-)
MTPLAAEATEQPPSCDEATVVRPTVPRWRPRTAEYSVARQVVRGHPQPLQRPKMSDALARPPTPWPGGVESFALPSVGSEELEECAGPSPHLQILTQAVDGWCQRRLLKPLCGLPEVRNSQTVSSNWSGHTKMEDCSAQESPHCPRNPLMPCGDQPRTKSFRQHSRIDCGNSSSSCCHAHLGPHPSRPWKHAQLSHGKLHRTRTALLTTAQRTPPLCHHGALRAPCAQLERTPLWRLHHHARVMQPWTAPQESPVIERRI